MTKTSVRSAGCAIAFPVGVEEAGNRWRGGRPARATSSPGRRRFPAGATAEVTTAGGDHGGGDHGGGDHGGGGGRLPSPCGAAARVGLRRRPCPAPVTEHRPASQHYPLGSCRPTPGLAPDSRGHRLPDFRHLRGRPVGLHPQRVAARTRPPRPDHELVLHASSHAVPDAAPRIASRTVPVLSEQLRTATVGMNDLDAGLEMWRPSAGTNPQPGITMGRWAGTRTGESDVGGTIR